MNKILFFLILILMYGCVKPPNNIIYQTDTLYINKTDSILITKIDTLIIKETDTVYLKQEYNIVEIKPISVTVDSFYKSSKLDPENMFDGVYYKTRQSPGTRWAVKGYPHIAVFNFDSLTTIDYIEFNIFAWDEGYTHKINIYNFSDKLISLETKPELFSRHKIKFVGTKIYIEITGGRNSWTDVGEVKFWKIIRQEN